MISLERHGGEIFVMDDQKYQLKIFTNDWTGAREQANISQKVDKLLVGETDLLRFPEAVVFINSNTSGRMDTYRLKEKKIHLKDGSHLIQIDANITAFVKFEGDGYIIHKNGHYIEISFSEQRNVALGFRSHHKLPKSTIQIPPTTLGVASAITNFSNSIRSSTPEKSYPSLRPHPPLITIDDKSTDVEECPRRSDDCEIKMFLPDNLCYLFIAAPLAYYLPASVVVENSNDAKIEIKDTDFQLKLPSVPCFQHAVADTLNRIFLLDCLVRNAGPFGEDIDELCLISEVGIDIDEVYSSSPAERITTYLEIQFDQIADRLPKWHLATYVEPKFEHVPALPYLLDRMSLIYLPEWEKPDRSILLRKSINDSYRTRDESSSNHNIEELVIPNSYEGQVKGWLANGIPIGAFKMHPSKISTPLDKTSDNRRPIRIIVVLNDGQMAEEQSAAGKIYQHRAVDLSVAVDIEYELCCSELIEVFERPSDFVHYIGHCDADGLRCFDGNVSASEIQRVRAKTFFLNACGSYHEGYKLIEQGSIAGGVTLASVLDQPASTVGTTFAQLLIHGFCIERALAISRRQTVMGINYTVVGDGTHVISQGEDSVPTLVEVETLNCENYKLSTEVFTPRDPGGFYYPYIDQCTKSRLFGNKTVLTLPRHELQGYLKKAKSPVIFDGEYIWSNDLYRKLKRE